MAEKRRLGSLSGSEREGNGHVGCSSGGPGAASGQDSKSSSSGGSGGGGGRYDEPPNSRLFIVCGRNMSEEDFREAFQRFGTIEEIWVVKDRNSGEPKGVTYVKFSKTSEAALAMEEMNGRCIGNNPRPLKVLIAHSRDQGSRRDVNEEERLLRLFVVVPKSMTEAELRDHFTCFGDIDYVSIVKDRTTKESKGFAYIKYHRVSHAAKAFEGCDQSFKPVFADPKPLRSSPADGFDRFSGPVGPPASTLDAGLGNIEGCTRLSVIASPSLNQDQLWRLFDLIPGLDYCQLRHEPKGRLGQGGQGKSQGQSRGLATVVYATPQSAAYAREKLHGFEYPPGQRLIVKLDLGGVVNSASPTVSSVRLTPTSPTITNNMPTSNSNPASPRSTAASLHSDLATLAETIAQATSLIQAAGLGNMGHPGATSATAAPAQPPLHPHSHALQHQHSLPHAHSHSHAEIYDPSYCSVKLPAPQPLAPIDSIVAERLFIVCHPSPPPIYALKDVFGRFGSLIDVYILNGKTCGYAKYANKDSADRAVVVLHGQEVCGARLKVMPADPNVKGDAGRKRIKMDDQQ